MDYIKILAILVLVVFALGCISQHTQADDGRITLIYHGGYDNEYSIAHDNVNNVTIYTRSDCMDYGANGRSIAVLPDYECGKPANYNPYNITK
jgi:hypothetical protein